MRVIDARNAFIMDSLLHEVACCGTAARAQATLKRTDLHGKTGTTNDSIDAWFAGYQPTLAGVAWMGYDTPRKMGSSALETGGGLSLPIWITYMEHALKGVPIQDMAAPEGVVNAGGEWTYDEYSRGSGVRSLGLENEAVPGSAPDVQALPPADEKKRILDLFKN